MQSAAPLKANQGVGFPQFADILQGLAMPPPKPMIPIMVPAAVGNGNNSNPQLVVPQVYHSNVVPVAMAQQPFFPQLLNVAATEPTQQLRESYLRALQQLQQQQLQQQQQGSTLPGAAMHQHSNSQQPNLTPTVTVVATNPMANYRITHSQQPQAPLIQVPEAPNLLYGFDQNILQTLVKPCNAVTSNTATEQASETILTNSFTGTEEVFVTSSSFDDFHRLLGNDVTIVGNSSVEHQSGGTTENNSARGNISVDADTSSTSLDSINGSAFFTAESYALLAHESASQASQLDAYHRTPELALGSLPVANANFLDIDGILKQIMTTAYGTCNTEGDRNNEDEGNAKHKATMLKSPPDVAAQASQLNEDFKTNDDDDKNANNSVDISDPEPESKEKCQQGSAVTFARMTPVERFVGLTTNVVSSGSEPSGDSVSSASGGQGFRSSGSDNDTDSLGNTSTDSLDDESSTWSSDSDSNQVCPQRKKSKLDHCKSFPSSDTRMDNSLGDKEKQELQRLFHHHRREL